jgi:hypothetical protein
VSIPEPLVTIRSYSAPQFAAEDREALLEAGIPAYFGGRYYRHNESVDLRVPASDADRALAVLGEPRPEQDLLHGGTDNAGDQIRCPLCRSVDVIPQPPYGLLVMVAGVAVTAYAITNRWFLAAGVALLVTTVVWNRVERTTAKWRCARCSHAWRDE